MIGSRRASVGLRLLIIAGMISACINVPTPGPEVSEPRDDIFVVRGNTCGDNAWGNKDPANDLSLWCWSKASVKQYPNRAKNITGPNLCLLRKLVNANTDPWKYGGGCAAKVKALRNNGAEVVYNTSGDGSGTGNHCHVSNIKIKALKYLMEGNAYVCPDESTNDE